MSTTSPSSFRAHRATFWGLRCVVGESRRDGEPNPKAVGETEGCRRYSRHPRCATQDPEPAVFPCLQGEGRRFEPSRGEPPSLVKSFALDRPRQPAAREVQLVLIEGSAPANPRSGWEPAAVRAVDPFSCPERGKLHASTGAGCGSGERKEHDVVASGTEALEIEGDVAEPRIPDRVDDLRPQRQ